LGGGSSNAAATLRGLNTLAGHPLSDGRLAELAAQLGTAFVATEECDADPGFKKVLAEAREEDMVEFTSVAGLPARAVKTPWLVNYLKAEPRLQDTVHKKPRCTLAFDCLAQCGLRDGLPGWGQFCIDTQLAAGLRGDLKKGLFFRGVGALPFGSRIVTVRDLIERLLTPASVPACA
jgi:nitronate monooxygenase